MFPFNIFDFLSFGKKRIQSERLKLVDELEIYREKLVPFDSEDIELLSFTISEKKVSKTRYGRGLFISIYDEALLSLAFKSFYHKKLKRMLIMETSNHHMLFIDRNAHIDCYFNNHLMGKMIPDRFLFYSPRKRLLGRIKEKGNGDYNLVIYKDKELAIMNPIEEVRKFNKRVFNLVKGNISKEEEVILMIMTFYYLTSKLLDFD